MKLPHLLATTAVGIGAAHLAHLVVQHRQQMTMANAEMHQQFLMSVAASPAQLELWKPADMEADEFAKVVLANQQISLLSAKHRVGLLKPKRLRVVADKLMTRPMVRTYWERYAGHRAQEADRTETRSNTLLARAYDAATSH
ncbi:DUF6082 family protein [Streptomyces pinistramenti]|uniref:DUF6082 family protein n=1 Tax=Streptomyces pinistramenti TaxID=2884812 RepID=UPI001D08844E|nr:DUF6082 family protein [Streptomyces pinistramenti]MCB5911967.1 DUF6082 family protein [Streptomyces pinistramenti]